MTRSAQVAIVLLGLYLILVFFSGLALVRALIKRQQDFMPEYLLLVGQTTTSPPRDYFAVLEWVSDEAGHLDAEALASYEYTTDWLNLRDSLTAAARLPDVRSAVLLTPAGDVIFEKEGLGLSPASPPENPAARPWQAGNEQNLLSTAIAGRVATREGSRRLPMQVVYIPVVTTSGKVVAALRLEASVDRMIELGTLRNRLFTGFLISGIILFALYVMTLRLVRRTIEAERAASQADRLRALGTMTAGIAHEIRNPLGILTLQVEELRAMARNLGEPAQRTAFTALATELSEETKRLKKLTEEFVGFGGASSGQDFRAVSVDAVAVIDNLVRVWSRSVSRENRDIAWSPPAPVPQGWRVIFTDDRLRQVLLNLLRNADEALGDRHGRIGIALRERGDRVDIVVEDNGPGIPPEVQAQIFDPFFTTRPEGTGLGLSLSRALAENAGGSLELQSGPGSGARFVLSLRRAA